MKYYNGCSNAKGLSRKEDKIKQQELAAWTWYVSLMTAKIHRLLTHLMVWVHDLMFIRIPSSASLVLPVPSQPGNTSFRPSTGWETSEKGEIDFSFKASELAPNWNSGSSGFPYPSALLTDFKGKAVAHSRCNTLGIPWNITGWRKVRASSEPKLGYCACRHLCDGVSTHCCLGTRQNIGRNYRSAYSELYHLTCQFDHRRLPVTGLGHQDAGHLCGKNWSR